MVPDIKSLLTKSYDIITESGIYAKKIRKDIYKNGFLKFDLDELLSAKETFAESEDLLMTDYIYNKIKNISNYPIILEESQSYLSDDTFWCIDPLDGSYCFSHDTGPYAILISLIYRSKPVLGLVNFPEENLIYVGAHNIGSYMIRKNKKQKLLGMVNSSCKNMRGIITNASPDPEPVKQYLRKFGITHFTETLGAPNPALLLSNQGDIMPLFHRQYEWDTAAYDAILRYANIHQKSAIYDMYGNPLTYGKQKSGRPFLNPDLIVTYNQKLINRISAYTRQKKL